MIFDRSSWPTDWILSDSATVDQSGPDSNIHEGVLHIPQISKTEVSSLDAVQCHTYILSILREYNQRFQSPADK